MKLTVKQVIDATPVITAILNENRPLPQMGRYRLLRMHSKLLAEHPAVKATFDTMVRAYDTPDPNNEGHWMVPEDQTAHFAIEWEAFGAKEIDVDIQPVPIADLCLADGSNGSISVAEFAALGSLVAD